MDLLLSASLGLQVEIQVCAAATEAHIGGTDHRLCNYHSIIPTPASVLTRHGHAAAAATAGAEGCAQLPGCARVEAGAGAGGTAGRERFAAQEVDVGAGLVPQPAVHQAPGGGAGRPGTARVCCLSLRVAAGAAVLVRTPPTGTLKGRVSRARGTHHAGLLAAAAGAGRLAPFLATLNTLPTRWAAPRTAAKLCASLVRVPLVQAPGAPAHPAAAHQRLPWQRQAPEQQPANPRHRVHQVLLACKPLKGRVSRARGTHHAGLLAAAAGCWEACTLRLHPEYPSHPLGGPPHCCQALRQPREGAPGAGTRRPCTPCRCSPAPALAAAGTGAAASQPKAPRAPEETVLL
eukprot:CAMPEP_0202885534 /NCGR_PEP_ID=MMETSP1391-20130828/41712_1 /ASSEMBLY_ACC=CAM_ASM_000867 /TAXON_ID=1034604 /ORGANISM="Chlamydomonas leiostraca, Strain SAG 11-49" /LENGTH=346 /DNA_ID=CAMNT_0049568785 /DNA_START=132 /DNA_END=1175 /DNA_ORIENTATION=+